MRRKTTIHNYGRYHEVCFVCNSRYLEYCTYLAQYMAVQYGIVATAMDYATFPQADRETKKVLRTAYHVIFMLSDGVIEECVAIPNHPFLQLYSYVHKHNGFAMSCAALDGYVVRDGLVYPPVMSSFDHMHRKALNTGDGEKMAKTLAREIRLYYSNYRKITLAHAHKIGVNGYVALQWGIEKYRGWHLVTSLLPIVFLALMTGVARWDVMSVMSLYVILMLPVYVVYAILDACIHVRRKAALYTNLERKEDVEDFYALPALQRQMKDKVTAILRGQWFKTALRIVTYFVYTILIMGYSTHEPQGVAYMVLFLFAHIVWCFCCSVSVFIEHSVIQSLTSRCDIAFIISKSHKRVSTVLFWVRQALAIAAAMAFPLAFPLTFA